MRSATDRRTSFTLIELLVVTSLLALAATVVTLRLDGISEAGRLHGAARQIGTLIQGASAGARLSGEPRLVEYQLDTERVRMRVPQRALGAWRWHTLRELDLNGVRIQRVIQDEPTSAEDSTRRLTIHSDGRCGEHGVVLQLHQRQAVVLAGGLSSPQYYFPVKSLDVATLDLLRREVEGATAAR